MKPSVHSGFTFIELLLVLSAIGILAAIAIPAYHKYLTRTYVMEGVQLAMPVQKAINDYYAWHGRFPASNRVLGLPPAEQLFGNYTRSIAVEEGRITLRYGNGNLTGLQDKSLVLSPQAPAQGKSLAVLRWHCSGGTDNPVDDYALPGSCK